VRNRVARNPGIALALCVCCIARAHAGAEIHGAGATFPAPVYAAWAEAYRREAGVVVRYDAVGSGKGIELIRARAVDFGASDVPLSPEDLEASGLIEFPAVIGGVVPVINIHGIAPGQLRLDGEVLAAIFLGRITRWNEDAIVALNPGLALPRSRITVVHRSDASGTSFLFTDYLSRVDSEWKGQVGHGTTVAWPVGVGGTGNEGVASYVQRTRSSIGYVEFAYAKSHRLSDVSLPDSANAYIRADADTFAAALAPAARARMDDSASLLVPTGRGWPITGATFILVPLATRDPEIRRDVAGFFAWSLGNGQALARELNYVPIPDASAALVVDEIENKLH